MRTALPFLAALWVAACAGDIPVHPDATRVDVSGDVFFIRVQGDSALIQNYATGLDNQVRLAGNARIAAQRLTGCNVTTLTQQMGVNSYIAALDCAAQN